MSEKGLTRAGGPEGYSDPFKDMDADKLSSFVKSKEATVVDALKVKVGRFCHAMSHIYSRESGLKWEWIDKKAVLLSLHAKAAELKGKLADADSKHVKEAEKMIETAEKLNKALERLEGGINPKHLAKYEDDIFARKEIIMNIINVGNLFIEEAQDKFAGQLKGPQTKFDNAKAQMDIDPAAALQQLIEVREESRSLDPQALRVTSLKPEELFEKTNIAIKQTLGKLKEKASDISKSEKILDQKGISDARDILKEIENALEIASTKVKAPHDFDSHITACKEAILEAKSTLFQKDLDLLETEIVAAEKGEMDVNAVSEHAKNIGGNNEVKLTQNQSEKLGQLLNSLNQLQNKISSNTDTASKTASKATTDSSSVKSESGVSIRDIQAQKAVTTLNAAMLKLTDVSTPCLKKLSQSTDYIIEMTSSFNWLFPGTTEYIQKQSKKSELLALFENYDKPATPKEAVDRAEKIFGYINEALIQAEVAEEVSESIIRIDPNKFLEDPEITPQVVGNVDEAYKEALKAYKNLQSFLPPATE